MSRRIFGGAAVVAAGLFGVVGVSPASAVASAPQVPVMSMTVSGGSSSVYVVDVVGTFGQPLSSQMVSASTASAVWVAGRGDPAGNPQVAFFNVRRVGSDAVTGFKVVSASPGNAGGSSVWAYVFNGGYTARTALWGSAARFDVGSARVGDVSLSFSGVPGGSGQVRVVLSGV